MELKSFVIACMNYKLSPANGILFPLYRFRRAQLRIFFDKPIPRKLLSKNFLNQELITEFSCDFRKFSTALEKIKKKG